MFGHRPVTLVLAGALATIAACGPGPPAGGADAAVQRGLAALEAGDTGSAMEAFVTALDADPNDVLALYNLGYLAQTMGEPASAERYYRAALDANPSFEAALFNLAILRERAGGTQEAIALYRRVVEVNAANAEALLNLGLLLLRAGRHEQAQTEIQAAIRQDRSLVDRLSEENVPAGTSP